MIIFLIRLGQCEYVTSFIAEFTKQIP